MLKKKRGEIYSIFGKETIDKIIKEDNKIILKKWPFLNACNSGYISTTWLDGIPDGWRFSFGEILCNEISMNLDENLQKDENTRYMILQVKEKYGELRWYDFNSTEKINNVITMFEYASRAICGECGELKVACINDCGYIIPSCKKCYDDNIEERKKLYLERFNKALNYKSYDDCVELEYEPTIKITSYSNNEKKEIIYDLTETYNKMQRYIDEYENWINSLDCDKKLAAIELMQNCILFEHAKQIIEKI